MGQTVNLVVLTFGGSNPPLPTSPFALASLRKQHGDGRAAARGSLSVSAPPAPPVWGWSGAANASLLEACMAHAGVVQR